MIAGASAPAQSERPAMPDRRDAEHMRGAKLPQRAAQGPVAFLWHYVRRRFARHLAVLMTVLAAVSCAVGAQYGVKNLVDTLVSGSPTNWELWGAVGVLLALVAGDNLLWRLAGWLAASAFVAVGGDLRLDLFEHLCGHGTRYFADRFPGALASRITTAANAVWTIENSLIWTTIPPAVAVVLSIGMLGTIGHGGAGRDRSGARRDHRAAGLAPPISASALRRARGGGFRQPRRRRRQYICGARVRRGAARAGAVVARHRA
jgi:hypothetical protein